MCWFCQVKFFCNSFSVLVLVLTLLLPNVHVLSVNTYQYRLCLGTLMFGGKRVHFSEKFLHVKFMIQELKSFPILRSKMQMGQCCCSSSLQFCKMMWLRLDNWVGHFFLAAFMYMYLQYFFWPQRGNMSGPVYLQHGHKRNYHLTNWAWGPFLNYRP